MGSQAATNFDSFEIVQTGVIDVPISSAIQNWTTVAHHLGYIPTSESYLDGVSLGAIFSNGVIQLPTYIDASITGSVVEFNAYMYAATDDTNIYFITLNATGSDLSHFYIKYYLKRERAR